MPAMRYGISFAHPACFTGDNSFAKAPVMAGSKQCGVPVPLSSPSRMSVAKVTNEDAGRGVRSCFLPSPINYPSTLSAYGLIRGAKGIDSLFPRGEVKCRALTPSFFK